MPGIEPDLVTLFRWRAERRCLRRNEQRLAPTYHWEVVRERVKVGCVYDDRWVVVAMQNRLEPDADPGPPDTRRTDERA